tara:strand:- start:1765 stop:1956 length:192 start_codon:yes stop_codon:yes gene_type:complete
MAKKVEIKEVAKEPKAVISLLDESKEYTIVGTGKRADIGRDIEFTVSGNIANILIAKGFAKIK